MGNLGRPLRILCDGPLPAVSTALAGGLCPCGTLQPLLHLESSSGSPLTPPVSVLLFMYRQHLGAHPRGGTRLRLKCYVVVV
jgi:hypothetical protein